MNPRVEKLFKLPIYQRLLILGIVLVAIAGGFVYLLILPEYSELKNLKEQSAQLETKIQQDRSIVNNLPQFKAEYERMKEQLGKALSELPNEKEIPTLLTSIASVAKENGLDVIRFKPGNEVRKGFYAEVPVELKLTGSYHQTAMFFDAVSNLSRIVNIQNLTMGGAKTAEGTTALSVDCLATTFRFIEESAQQGNPAEQKK